MAHIFDKQARNLRPGDVLHATGKTMLVVGPVSKGRVYVEYRTKRGEVRSGSWGASTLIGVSVDGDQVKLPEVAATQ